MSPSKDPLQPVKQSVALLQLIEEMAQLNKLLIELPLNDELSQQNAQEIQLELDAFKKILQDDKEYTEKQVEALCRMMEQLKDRLNKITSPEQVLQELVNKFAMMNGGESPVKNVSIDLTFTEDFKKKMAILEAQCDKVIQQAERVQENSPGREFSLTERFAKACKSVANGIKSFFKAAIHIAKESKYLAERAAIKVGAIEETDETRVAALQHDASYLTRCAEQARTQAAKVQQDIEDKQAGRQMREGAEAATKPKVFRKR